MSRKSISGKTRRLAICSVMAALGVVILELGTLLQVFDISASIGASIIILLMILEYGGAYPMLVFAVTGVLSLILIPSNSAAWLYLGFFGYYPMLKFKFERFKKPVAVILKLVSINVAVAAYLLVIYLVLLGGTGSLTDIFSMGFGDEGENISLILGWAMVALIEFMFIVYDFLLSRITILYNFRWRQLFSKFFR